MNLIFHIIKKDLRRMAWVLMTWVVAGGYLITYRKMEIVQRSMWDNIGIVSLFLFGALTLVLIAGIVQEDGLTEGAEYWRTRPISPGRLLTAKLGLILPLFVVLPLLIVVVQSSLMENGPTLRGSDYAVPFLIVMVLACMAVASCTKDLGRYFLFGVLCLFVPPMLASWLKNLFPGEAVSKMQEVAIDTGSFRAMVIWVGVMAMAVILNQYSTRRTRISIGMLGVTVLGLACIGAFWRWTF